MGDNFQADTWSTAVDGGVSSTGIRGLTRAKYIVSAALPHLGRRTEQSPCNASMNAIRSSLGGSHAHSVRV
jgi:hypothetical protein